MLVLYYIDYTAGCFLLATSAQNADAAMNGLLVRFISAALQVAPTKRCAFVYESKPTSLFNLGRSKVEAKHLLTTFATCESWYKAP